MTNLVTDNRESHPLAPALDYCAGGPNIRLRPW
jgi:hypothetical protein